MIGQKDKMWQQVSTYAVSGKKRGILELGWPLIPNVLYDFRYSSEFILVPVTVRRGWKPSLCEGTKL